MNKSFHKIIFFNFYKKNQSIYNKKTISLPKKKFIKLSTSGLCNKSCNNKDSNNKIVFHLKNKKIDNKKEKNFNIFYQDLNKFSNSILSKRNSLSNKFNKYILCSKKLILKNNNNTITYRGKYKKLKSFTNLNNSNSSLYYTKKKKTMSMDSYELEKSKFNNLLFDENICISKKKFNLEYFLKKFNNENFINQLYLAKFNN